MYIIRINYSVLSHLDEICHQFVKVWKAIDSDGKCKTLTLQQKRKKEGKGSQGSGDTILFCSSFSGVHSQNGRVALAQQVRTACSATRQVDIQ